MSSNTNGITTSSFTAAGSEKSITAQAVGTSFDEKIYHVQNEQGKCITKFEFLGDPVGEAEGALDLTTFFGNEVEHWNRTVLEYH